MKQYKNLYNKTKRLSTEEAWRDYRNMKNNVITLIHEVHKRYQNKMFSENCSINYITIRNFGDMLKVFVEML